MLNEPPEDHAGRKRVIGIILTGFALITAMAATRKAVMTPDPLTRLLTGAVALLAVAWVAYKVRTWYVQVRTMYRLNRDQCTRCGHATKDGGGVRCPECGLDPFEE